MLNEITEIKIRMYESDLAMARNLVGHYGIQNITQAIRWCIASGNYLHTIHTAGGQVLIGNSDDRSLEELVFKP